MSKTTEQDLRDKIQSLKEQLSDLVDKKDEGRIQKLREKFEGKYFKNECDEGNYASAKTIKVEKIVDKYHIQLLVIKNDLGTSGNGPWNHVSIETDQISVDRLEDNKDSFDYFYKAQEIDESEFYERFGDALVKLEELFSIDVYKIGWIQNLALMVNKGELQ
jgi:hypothetical protein